MRGIDFFTSLAERGFPEIWVEYFVPDGRKTGGTYITLTGRFRRIDEYGRRLVLYGGGQIPIDDIYRLTLLEAVGKADLEGKNI